MNITELEMAFDGSLYTATGDHLLWMLLLKFAVKQRKIKDQRINGDCISWHKEGLWFDRKYQMNLRKWDTIVFWGFKLSSSKSCYMHPTRKRGMQRQSLEQHGWPMEKVRVLGTMYIYRAVMRSSKGHGCWVYGAAAKTHLNGMDSVQNKTLRLVQWEQTS